MIVLASSSSAADTIVGLAVLLVWLSVLVICGLKGKPWFVVLGVFFGVFALVGAIRLAKPNSWWDRHRYDSVQHQQAVERFN